VTPDGSRESPRSLDETLRVWDLEAGRALHTLEGRSSAVLGVTFPALRVVYAWGMAKRQDQKALRNMIAEAKRLLETAPELPEGRSRRANELLGDAVVLTDYLLTVEPAAVLGAKGGKATAKRGPAYFRQIAAMRKTRAGGRPRKEPR